MTISRSFLLAALLCVSAGACAQVYECTDAGGKKTYAKDCPPNTVKEKELGSPGVASPGSMDASKEDKLRQANEAFEKRRAQRQKQQAESDKRDADARSSAQACSDARARLDALQSGRPARRVDPVSGEHVADDDTQLQTQIDGLNAQVAQHCK